MELNTVRDIQSALAQLKLPMMDQDVIAVGARLNLTTCAR